MKKKIAVIFSFYNEEKNILKSVNEVSKVLESIEEIDYELIYDNSQLIIDTRNVFKNKSGNHLKRLGQG